MRHSHVRFIIGTALIHIVFLFSIFDIYFTSPLLHGMRGHQPNVQAPAKRLVLFIADGLRADKCFGFQKDNLPYASYLRHIIHNEGVWGISRTRAPTETRPGHIAIIAGFYEDVSAIKTGWQENPVEFDSVFNRSRHTWSWGAPDVLPIFSKGIPGDRMETSMYSPEFVDRARRNTKTLDTWVFDTVRQFFEQAARNESLKQELNRDKIVLFMHLLGIDTSGHFYNPNSISYLSNIPVVDQGIKHTVNLINSYYGDSKTAFILTSDHGHVDKGGHGGGHPEEILTPLVAWGAGLAKPVEVEPSSQQDWQQWQLSGLKRNDINQADVAPLMASLLGLSFPVNSVGKLNPNLLSVSMKDKAELLYTNALEIVEQFLVNMRTKQSSAFFFRPFSRLSLSSIEDKKRTIRGCIRDGHYAEAISLCEDLIDVGLEGLMYYYKYDRLFLGSCITLGFIGWMLYTVCLLLQNYVSTPGLWQPPDRSQSYILWWLLRLIICVLSYVHDIPWMHLVYTLAPTFPWEQVLSNRHMLLAFIRQSINNKNFKSHLWTVAVVIIGLELAVHSFFYRELLSVSMLLLTVCHMTSKLWVVSCILVAIFPLLPIVGGSASYYLVFSAGVAGVVILGYYYSQIRMKFTFLQLIVLLVAIADKLFVFKTDKHGTNLPKVCQVISWIILGSTWVVPVLGSRLVLYRLVAVNVATFTLCILMSISYEPWFFLGLSIFIYSWLWVEKPVNNKMMSCKEGIGMKVDQNSYLSMDDLKRAYIYLLLILVALFGTSNIASINRFESSSVYCFLTVFNQFNKVSLHIFKIALPFVLVASCFNAISSVTGMRRDGIFLLTLLMSDFMSLHFFAWVKDSGSWLDIGISISHYVITLSLNLALILLSMLTQPLMSKSFVKTEDNNLIVANYKK